MSQVFVGNIACVRDVEDCIRATKKYTKGAFRKEIQHPIQGGEFPSKQITEHYEVYPDTELSWDMSASEAWAWVWGDVSHIDVVFRYDYQKNWASVTVKAGREAVIELARAIPNFSDTLAKAVVSGNGHKSQV